MPSPFLRAVLYLAVLVLVVVVVCQRQLTLPIYTIAHPVVTAGNLGQAGPFVPAGATMSETPDRLVFRSGGLRMEVYKTSGGFWLEDTTRLWNPDTIPQLPDSSQLRPSARTAATHATKDSIGFTGDRFTTFEYRDTRPTLAIIRDSARSDTIKLDWRVGYAARVSVRRPWWTKKYDVVGGGGDFGVHYGDRGRVIGLHGVWRKILGVKGREPIVSLKDANRQVQMMLAGTRDAFFEAPYIAYYSAPAPFYQEALYPVYVYTEQTIEAGDTIAVGVVTVPATRAEVQDGAPDPVPSRPNQSNPRPESKPDEGTGGSEAEREVATSWIGSMAALPKSRANAVGFLEAMISDGWAVNYDWGEMNAWYDDWNANRDKWADSADLLFYSGHATMGGWQLYDPVNSTDVYRQYRRLSNLDTEAVTGGMYGATDLEWMVISACGPLQDEELAAGGGSAIDRWKNAFGGLHILLGYGSVTMDNADEGRLFAKYALEGKTVINAWLRATEEVQKGTNGCDPPDGPTIYAGAMWARVKGKRSTYYDHLHGHGDVAEDPKVPDEWGIIWSPT